MVRVGHRMSPIKVLFIIGLSGKEGEGHGVGVMKDKEVNLEVERV